MKKLRITHISFLGFTSVTVLSALCSAQSIGTPTAFDDSGLMSEEIDARGNASRHVYDRHGALDFVALPEGLSRGFVASQSAALPESPGSEAAPIPPATDEPGSAFIQYGDGEVRENDFVLGSQGKTTSEVQSGITTSFQRNIDGKVTMLGLPSGQTIETSYDAAGNVCMINDPLFGNSAVVTYDSVLNLPVQTTFADGATVRAEFDAQGNRTATISAAGRRTSATFNDLGQVATETDVSGTIATLGLKEVD